LFLIICSVCFVLGHPFFVTDLVADEGHPAVVRPREADDWRISVVDKLDRPAALVLDPHEDDAGSVAGGQLLVGLVPPNKGHLQ
jgi:hypothetical protein